MTRYIWNFFAAAMILGSGAAQAGVPFPSPAAPKPIDAGLLRNLAAQSEISVTVLLRLRDFAGAENLLTALTTPGDPQYHKFLTPPQFLAKFGPSEADAATVEANLRRYGLTVERTASLSLRVTGTPAKIESAFGVSLHQYDVPAQGGAAAYHFRAPLEHPKLPEAVSTLVTAVVGLDTRPRFRPRSRHVPAALHGLRQSRQTASINITNSFGFLTVTDFAQYYDVKPLYDKGLTGSGRTIGIVTLANFTASDAFTYWNSLGLAVDPNRITIVNVDGGPGAPSDESGSDETTLDVEQAGGVAPGAKIIVYMAPNTDQAFIDAFAAAIDANAADSISVSWGLWEWFGTLQNAPVTDPTSGNTVAFMQAMHGLFLQAGIQGQSLFAASGDSGAYDASGFTSFKLPLTVDYPASDSAITAAGGTTLPGTQEYLSSISINIPKERVWGWDYLVPVCSALGLDVSSCGIYPVGGGGGVSFIFPTPTYQMGISGIKTSESGQVFVDDSVNPPKMYKLPAGVQGRNVPDISANADPDTGYIVGYTPSNGSHFSADNCVTGVFCTVTFFGGTSFVAPQLNGVTALLVQKAKTRLGLLNAPLYNLVRKNAGLNPAGPLHYISTGDNWFYHGQNSYNPGAGAGVLDVAKVSIEPGFH